MGTDPMIDYESEDGLGDLDQIQNDEDATINERSPRGLRLNEENEEPVELQGLDDLPLERSKYYALLNDMENDDRELPSLGIEEEESMTPEDAMTASMEDDEAGQQETFNDYDPELIANEADAIFDRRERMDVKKTRTIF